MQEYTVTVNVDDENETCATVVASTDPNIAVGSTIELDDRYDTNHYNNELILGLALENETGFRYRPVNEPMDRWTTGDITLRATAYSDQSASRLGMGRWYGSDSLDPPLRIRTDFGSNDPIRAG